MEEARTLIEGRDWGLRFVEVGSGRREGEKGDLRLRKEDDDEKVDRMEFMIRVFREGKEAEARRLFTEEEEDEQKLTNMFHDNS